MPRLHETLGISWKDSYFMYPRPEVTRMKDRDGDGRADVFETAADDGLMEIIMSMPLVPAMIKMEIFG